MVTCSNNGKLDLAFDIFRKVLISDKLDTFIFTTLINACLKCNEPKRAIPLFDEIQRLSIPLDGKCFSMFTRVCAKTGDSILAKKLFLKVKNKEFKFDINVIDFA